MQTVPTVAAVTASTGIQVQLAPYLQLAMLARTALAMASQKTQTGTSMVVTVSACLGTQVWIARRPSLVTPPNIAMRMVSRWIQTEPMVAFVSASMDTQVQIALHLKLVTTALIAADMD